MSIIKCLGMYYAQGRTEKVARGGVNMKKVLKFDKGAKDRRPPSLSPYANGDAYHYSKHIL